MAWDWTIAEVSTMITLYCKYFNVFGDIKCPSKRKRFFAKIRMSLREAGYDRDIDAIRKKFKSLRDYYHRKTTDGTVGKWVHYAAMKKILSTEAGNGEKDDGETAEDRHSPRNENDAAAADGVLSVEDVVIKEETDAVAEEDSNTNMDPFVGTNKESTKPSNTSLAARKRIRRYQRYWKASKMRKRDPEDSADSKMSSWMKRDNNWDEIEPDNPKPHMGTTNIMNCLFCYKTIDGSSTSKQETCSVQKQLDDNGRVIFILKKLLGITKDELVSYLGDSAGCGPSAWIGICTSCNILVAEAEKILEKISSLERELMHIREQCEEKVQKSFKCTHTKSLKDPCFTCISANTHEKSVVTNKVRQSVIARKFTNPQKILEYLMRLENPRPATDESVSSPWKGRTRTRAASAKTVEYHGDDDDTDLTEQQTGFDKDDGDFQIDNTEVVDDDDVVNNDEAVVNVDGEAVDDEYEVDEDGAVSEVDFSESSGSYSDTNIEKDKMRVKRKRRKFSTRKSCRTRTMDKDDSKNLEVLGGSFTCPICPNLPLRKPMNILQFVHHLTFHHEHPYQCVQCKGFLPKDAEKRTFHWNLVHSLKKSEVGEGERYSYVNVTTSEVKIYNCEICQEYFNTAEQRDAHVLELHSSSVEKIIRCSDCSESFVSLFELKLHQALIHPTVAKQSCPACMEKFRGSGGELDELAFLNHVCDSHPSVQIPFVKLCKLCGFPFETHPRIPSASYGKAYHFKTFHGDILGTVYKCSLCEFEGKGFHEHQKHLHDAHSKVVSKAILRDSSIEMGEMVRSFPRFRLRCSACFLDMEEENANAIDTPKTIYFQCGSYFEEHLKEAHFLNLEFKQISSDTFRSSQAWTTRLKQLECSGIEVIRKRKHRLKKCKEPPPMARTKNKNVVQSVMKHEVNFECPACPNLDKMDLDSFIVHILFHWRQPHRCSSCGVYLPIAEDLIDQHCKFHGNTASSGERVTLVNFDPGKVWSCADPSCEEKFAGVNERDAHEKDIHNIGFDSAVECKVCSLPFRDVNDVRLHKALAHPEHAELCCTYCDESFGVVSKEGPTFRHARYLLDHLIAKECYDPGEPRRNILEDCTLCGKVFSMPTVLVKHMRENHGILKEKLFTCFICYQQCTVREIKRHIYETHGPRPVCEICGITINWTKGLKHHKYQVHGISEPGLKVHKCPVEGCNYETTRTNYLTIHKLKRHETNKTRNHSCQYCGRTFFWKTHLKRHEEIHTNANTNKYVCEICGKGFPVQNYLYTHVRVNHQRNWHYKYKKRNRK